MKNLILILAILSSTIFVSCVKKGEEPQPSNQSVTTSPMATKQIIGSYFYYSDDKTTITDVTITSDSMTRISTTVSTGALYLTIKQKISITPEGNINFLDPSGNVNTKFLLVENADSYVKFSYAPPGSNAVPSIYTYTRK